MDYKCFISLMISNTNHFIMIKLNVIKLSKDYAAIHIIVLSHTKTQTYRILSLECII